MVPNAVARIAAIAFTLASQASRAAEQPAVPAPASPGQVTMTLTPQSSGAFGLFWSNEAPTCDSGAVKPTAWVAPQPQFAPKMVQKYPVTIAFGIDGSGRAIDIKVLEGGYVEGRAARTIDPGQGILRVPVDNLLKSMTTRDLMPSLRASRFAAGAPQTGCRITYTPEYIATEDLSLNALARIGAAPGAGLSNQLRDRLGGADCNTARWPDPLVGVFPAWRKVSGLEGDRKWSWIGFDIDDEGVPVNVAVIASSGHEDLDAETRRAARETRFAEGPRKGCVTSWWRNPLVIRAPRAPSPNSFAGYQDCKASRRWAVAPQPVYPPPYKDRAIEGWALLGFDVGADGAISKVTVIAAQPSEEFGAAGMAVLRSARFEPSETAQTRCIERVRFAMDKS